MSKTIVVLLDACGYEVGTEYLGYLEHLVDYGMAAKYRVRGELPSMSRPMYETLLTKAEAAKAIDRGNFYKFIFFIVVLFR